MKDKYAKDGEVYKEEFEKEGNKERSPSNIITIAGRRIETYIETMLRRFQKFDQIEICCLDRYLDRAIIIIQMWEAVGITPINGKINFEKREEDLIERDERGRATGGKYKRAVNRITLTKQPDQFRFTAP